MLYITMDKVEDKAIVYSDDNVNTILDLEKQVTMMMMMMMMMMIMKCFSGIVG